MPKRVDHEERRRQIADALLRTAAARGLHATGMREVAAEAGVSLRLVQYYFGTKEELLLAAMQQLAARFAARATARFRSASGPGGPASPRDVIAAILAEGLPADDDRRTFHLVYTAYLALSLTDPALAIAPLVKNSGAVIDVMAAQLRAAQAAGDTPAHLDPGLEAFSLTAMSAGLATSVLAGQSSAGQAQAVIDYHLDRLFPAPRPALPAEAALSRSGLVIARVSRMSGSRSLSEGVSLASAVPGDVPELLALWAVAAENDSRPGDTAQAVLTLLDRDPGACLIARQGDRIVGTLIAGWDGWRAHLYRLAVHPAVRRQGIAQALLDAGAARLRSLGATRLDAMVLEGNELGQALWHAAGYSPQAQWRRWIKPVAGPPAL